MNSAQGTVRVHLGYAAPSYLLPFVTADLGIVGQIFSYSNEFGDRYSSNSTQVGWVLGAGLEYRLQNGFSFRGEYLYANYGNSIDMALPGVKGAADPTGQANAGINSSVARAGLNYRF